VLRSGLDPGQLSDVVVCRTAESLIDTELDKMTKYIERGGSSLF
jgi:hypothetical protein